MIDSQPAVLAQLARIENDGRETRARVEDLDKLLRGDRGGGDPGLLTEVDRLKQSESRRAVWSVTAMTAAIGAVVAAAWSVLTKGGHQ